MAADNGTSEVGFSRVTTDRIFSVETPPMTTTKPHHSPTRSNGFRNCYNHKKQKIRTREYHWTFEIVDFGLHGFEIRFPLHGRKSFAPKNTEDMRLPHPWYENI